MWYSAIGCLVTLTLSLLAAPLAADAPAAGEGPSDRCALVGLTPCDLGPLAHSSKGCAISAMWRDSTSSLSTAMRRGTSTGSPTSRPSWSACRWICSLLGAVASCPGCQACDHHDPHCLLWRRRSRRARAGRQPRAARREHHRGGLRYRAARSAGKRLELLKEAVPTVSRVAMLSGRCARQPLMRVEKVQERAAQALGLTLRYFYVPRPEAFTEWVFPAITADRHAIDALSRGGSRCDRRYRRQIADFALQHRLPMIGIQGSLAEAGGLLSYGPTQRAMQQRAAVLVGKILQGRQAGGPARGAAHEVRAGHQPQDRQGARDHDTPDAPLPGGRGDPLSR